ncbi:LytR/AlgR family response regulator transcription factor [Pedobacter duraquae]|uniref:LytTR family two component transcriptional regulator n=1 Tax=Pedobacter duraquae TaxID=425511 RepID=A0A4R6ILB0_9SPHI|nr:LytTR family DNA-binding domain-containing protein [Pedobacter duraquae]TDO22882.1 LytTR family two component transcriptional regulator [Pedobacter duraquae]
MKCVILDDEPLAHQVLEHYIMQTPGLSLVAKFRNAVEAYEYMGKHHVDLLFLDVEMPLINGISFLTALAKPPKTIFTTAYKQYAFEGFELNAVDYLLKPFSYERFVTAVNKLGSLSAENESMHTLIIKDKGGFLNLRQQDVWYVEGCKDYVKIVTPEKTHVIYHTLKGILEKLDPVQFVQIHRSYLVNRIYIARILQDSVVLADQQTLPVGQVYKKYLLNKLK